MNPLNLIPLYFGILRGNTYCEVGSGVDLLVGTGDAAINIKFCRAARTEKRWSYVHHMTRVVCPRAIAYTYGLRGEVEASDYLARRA